MLKVTNTKNAPAAIGPYCQAIAVNGFLFTSGQIPVDPNTGELAGASIEEQTVRVLENLKAVLEANNIDFKNVVKTTCFLTDMANYAAFNEIYAKYFVSNPARSCIAVKQLPKNVLVEVELVAYLGK